MGASDFCPECAGAVLIVLFLEAGHLAEAEGDVAGLTCKQLLVARSDS